MGSYLHSSYSKKRKALKKRNVERLGLQENSLVKYLKISVEAIS